MAITKMLGVLSPAHILYVTLFGRAKYVGTDPLGNKYFRAKPRTGYKRERRWVMYKRAPDPSGIPPEWHGWIHHQTDIFPDEKELSFRRPWQKPPVANLTGTPQAYRPPGDLTKGGQRSKATGDYEAWVPPGD